MSLPSDFDKKNYCYTWSDNLDCRGIFFNGDDI